MAAIVSEQAVEAAQVATVELELDQTTVILDPSEMTDTSDSSAMRRTAKDNHSITKATMAPHKVIKTNSAKVAAAR